MTNKPKFEVSSPLPGEIVEINEENFAQVEKELRFLILWTINKVNSRMKMSRGDIVLTDEDIREVYQRSVARIWKYRGTFDRRRGKLSSWTVKVVNSELNWFNRQRTNKLRDFRRNVSLEGTFEHDHLTHEQRNCSPLPVELTRPSHENAIILRQVISNLDPAEQELVKRLEAGMTIVEIADELNVSDMTVLNRRNELRARLKAALNGEVVRPQIVDCRKKPLFFKPLFDDEYWKEFFHQWRQSTPIRTVSREELEQMSNPRLPSRKGAYEYSTSNHPAAA